jgi:hypothetical protein
MVKIFLFKAQYYLGHYQLLKIRLLENRYFKLIFK